MAPIPPHPLSTKGCTTFELSCCPILCGSFPTQPSQAESWKFIRTCRSLHYFLTFFILSMSKWQRHQVHSQRNVPAPPAWIGNAESSNTKAFPQLTPGWVLVLGVWWPSKTTHPHEAKLGLLILLVVNYWNTHTNLPILKKRKKRFL